MPTFCSPFRFSVGAFQVFRFTFIVFQVNASWLNHRSILLRLLRVIHPARIRSGIEKILYPLAGPYDEAGEQRFLIWSILHGWGNGLSFQRSRAHTGSRERPRKLIMPSARGTSLHVHNALARVDIKPRRQDARHPESCARFFMPTRKYLPSQSHYQKRAFVTRG